MIYPIPYLEISVKNVYFVMKWKRRNLKGENHITFFNGFVHSKKIILIGGIAVDHQRKKSTDPFRFKQISRLHVGHHLNCEVLFNIKLKSLIDRPMAIMHDPN